MSTTKTLKTSRQIVLANVAAAARAEAAAERARRFDAAAYTCRREGPAWIAEGPAGNVFRFTKAPNGEDIEVASASGGRYELTMGEDLQRHCNCPDSAKRDRETGCKHLVGWAAVKLAARMARELEQVA